MQPPDPRNVNLGRQGPLILVGASVRAAAQSARRAGFCVTGVDLFGDTDALAACTNYVPLDKHALGKVTRLHPDAATPLLVVGGIDRGQEDWLDPIRHYYQSDDQDRPCGELRQPERLQDVADAAGIRFPETRRLLDCEEIRSPGWLIKDRSSCGGLGIRWATSILGMLQQGDCAAARLFAQHWVPGRPHGAVFLSEGSKAQLLGVCRGIFTRMGDRPFVYAGSVGPIALNEVQVRRIRELGNQIIQRIPLTGLFNVDLMFAGDEIWLLEVNARWSASCELIEQAMWDAGVFSPSQSLVGHLIAGQIPDPVITAPHRVYWKRIVFARSSGLFSPGGISRTLPPAIQVRDVPHCGRVIRKGEPILTLVAPLSPAIVWQRLRGSIQAIQQSVVGSACAPQ